MSQQPAPQVLEDDPSPPTNGKPGQEATTDRPASKPQLLGKRRRFVLRGYNQLRTGLMVTTVVLVLLFLLNLSLYAIRESKTADILADVPELDKIIHSQNRVEFSLLLLASVVFLSGVFVVTILETHKTAGAAYALSQRLNDIRNGRYHARLRLRKDDHLRELERAFNDMSRSLQERTWREIEAFEQLARDAECVSTPIEAKQLAGRLREQAEQRRQLAG